MKVWLFALGMILATAGGAMGAPKAEFVYAATDAGSIYQFRIGASGALQPLTPPSVFVDKQSFLLVLHPSGRFAYAVTIHEYDHGQDDGQVFCYRINANGTLALLSPKPLSLNTPVDNVTMDPKGRFLFASGEDKKLFTFRIRHDGTLEPLADNTVVGTFHIDTQGDGGGELTGAYSQDVMTFDPAGRFLYVFANTGFVDHSEYQFVTYRLDTPGVLQPVGQIASGQGQNSLAFSTPRGGLFVVRHGPDKEGTYQFRIGPRGLPVPMTPPVLTDRFALLATEGMDGETLWTALGGHSQKDAIASYRVDHGGRLTVKAANAGMLPPLQQFAANRSGRFFYGANYQNDGSFTKPYSYSSLLGYTATSQGTLKAVGAPPVRLDGSCLSLVVDSGA